MSAPTWALPFPAGVADAGAAHALVRDAAGHCVELGLADGQVRWRSESAALLPLLLDGELAIVLALAPPRVTAFALPEAGRVRWVSEALPWPAWAASEPELGASSELRAAWLEGDVLLWWRLHRPFVGGIARAGQEPLAAQGSCRLDRSTGARRCAGLETAPPPEAPGLPSGDAEVLAQRALGGIQYRLHARPEGDATLTRISALRGERLLWSTPLGAVPRRRPPPRRPRDERRS
jgi:hypothetical protein